MSNSNESSSLFSEFPPVSDVEWEKAIQHDLNGADYREKLRWITGEGIEVLPFYREEDLTTLKHSPEPVPSKRHQNRWNICQTVFEQDAGQANKTGRDALKCGADALGFRYHVLATAGMLGGDLEGTAIQNQQDFYHLIKDIDLASTPLHFDSGMASPVLLSMLSNACADRDIDAADIQSTFLYDPYAFILTNGQYPKPEDQFIAEARQMTSFCNSTMPGVRCLGVDAQIFHNAGATVVQELGYAMAVGNDYVAGLTGSGFSVDDVTPHIHFRFAIGANYFLEIAKFRAARILWKLIVEAYKPTNSASTVAYLHGQSSEWNKTVFDPHTNMLRATTEGMAGAVGGCDTITLYPFDQSYKQPDDFSIRIARNAQIIMKQEASLNRVTDPSAGSYYIEVLTDKIAGAAWECFREVEQQGGMLKSIQDGYIQTSVEESRKQREQAIAERRHIFVGINNYARSDDSRFSIPDSGFSAVSLQTSEVNTDIDRDALVNSLAKALRDGAQLGDLIPDLLQPGKHDIRPIRSYRGPQAFEELRMATHHHSFKPKVLTLPLGDKKLSKTRSSFAVNFFSCAGYDIVNPTGFDSVEEAVRTIDNKQPDIVVLCSSDEEYTRLIPQLCEALDKLDNRPLFVVAGYPEDELENYKSDGVDAFVHRGSNALEKLRWFQRQFGIIKEKD